MSRRQAKLGLALVVACCLAPPAIAQGSVPIYSLSPSESSTQAGGHADIVTGVEVGAPGATEPFTEPCRCNSIRDLKIDTPPGLIAAPTDIPQCSSAELATHSCPVDSQVGLLVVRFFPDAQGGFYNFGPLYNMEAREDELALLATPAPLAATPIYIDITSRTESDYGLEFTTFGIPNILPPNQLTTIFWGVPAERIHDALRFSFTRERSISCGDLGGYNPIPRLLANEYPPANCESPPPPVSANSTVAPFVQNPTACPGPLKFSAETFAHDLGTAYMEALFPATTGCDQLSFEPSLAAKPTTTEADSPSGLEVDLSVPQSLSPSTPTPSAIRDVTVSLPQGVSINPNAADGKTACSDAQARFGTREAAQCPEYSKVGSIEITSSSFPAVLPGALYLGEPQPGNRYRVFMVFDGIGLHVKLPGITTPDPATGQLSITFRDLPQFNFQEFNMHIFGAERGLLVTPERCGTYAVNSEFTPWAFPAIPKQTSTQFFRIDSGPGGSPCPGAARPFAPRLSGGVSDNTAGAHSAFSVDLSRDDGDQNLTGLTVTTPPGFSATLRGIPYCPEAAIARLEGSVYSGLQELASSSCPAGSQVGTVVAGAGAGSRPLFVGGKVYWAGPYKGAPLSLVIVIPAVSGPYDLGNVAVRVALKVDPLTAQVTAVSDPLPRILEGIPLRARRIRVNLDRPGFTLNPTNCDPFSINAEALGDEGAVADLSVPFQVANCAVLPFSPRLALRLTGGVRRRGHPAIHAVLSMSPGEANARRISVTLPKGELLDNAHIGVPCTKVQFAARACPASALLGSAEVTTPLLDKPLTGKVYLRSSTHDLPDMALDLKGQIDIAAIGRIDSVKARLRATFEAVPDVPVSKIQLDLLGGSKGLLQNSTTLCGAGRKASARMVAQSGRHADFKVGLEVPCGGHRHSKTPHRRAGRGV